MKRIKLHLVKNQPVCIAIALLLLCSVQGCKYYYKVQAVSKVTPQEFKKYDSLNKYFILHRRDKAWHLSQALISENMLYGKLSDLPANRYKYQITKPTGGNRYIKRKKLNELYVLEEVHLFMSDSVATEKFDSGSIKIPFSKIRNAEIYVKANGRTTASWIIPAIGVPVLAVGIIGIIVGASDDFLGIGGHGSFSH